MTWINEEQRALAKREAQEARNEAYRKAAAIIENRIGDYQEIENPAHQVIRRTLSSAAKVILAEITE